MKVLVVLVDEMRRVLGILLKLLDHVSREELAVRLFDAPVQLAHQFTRSWAIKEMHLLPSGWRWKVRRQEGRGGAWGRYEA